MNTREGRFTGARGVDTYYRYWLSDGPPRALVLLAHGAGEHSGRYAKLAEYLTARDYAVAALAHVGHGKSAGTPGFVERFDDYLDSLYLLQRQLDGDIPDPPRILLGHSMGGLICALYLLRHQEDFIACILSGPAIMAQVQPGALQLLLIRLLSAVRPRLGVLQLDASAVSRDPQVVRDYLDDPLVHHGKLSARKVAQLFAAMQRIQRQAAQITLPMLLLHGASDTLASPDGSRFLFEHISSKDKILKIYPDLYHEIFNEPERETVMADVVAWCNDRTGERTSTT
ncbi:MAG: lysophospholipase [Halioglobus sp.]|nr:lysophospholipase [Halioglobus sp.]